MRRAWLVALAVSVLVHVAGAALLVGLAALLPGERPAAQSVPPSVSPAKRALMKVGLMAREPKAVPELPAPAGRAPATSGRRAVDQPEPVAAPALLSPLWGEGHGEGSTAEPGPAEGVPAEQAGAAGVTGATGLTEATGLTGGGTEPGAPTNAPGATNASLIAAMHARLAASAERCYPDAARRFRQQGVVEVSFCVGASGAVAKLALGGTTGSSLLDRAARECVVPNAAPFPELATGECFSVPVRFGQR